MSWFSILPSHLITFEVWAIRVFLFLALVTIGPWLVFIAYDFLLYLYRSATYNIPMVGGKARGRQRPRAPSLTERPDGHRRAFSFSGQIPMAKPAHEITTANATNTFKTAPKDVDKMD